MYVQFVMMIFFSAADNILFNRDGIKLGDFSVSVDLKEMTDYVEPCGTVPYMPPELFRGEKCGRSVDVYEAAGVIIHLFSGSIPWAGYEQERIIFQVRKAMVIE
jgi:serine/threonine protein kinase